MAHFKKGVYIEATVFQEGKWVVIRATEFIKWAWGVADSVCKEITGKEIVITSILDGTHKENSKHYEGNAFDMRTWRSRFSPTQFTTFVEQLKERLGKDYDVVVHSTHIHVEFDPK